MRTNFNSALYVMGDCRKSEGIETGGQIKDSKITR